ncbi:MAG TPA: PDDEXK nuclease domain-containing protein, partial [bacterium]|nr:PDDEXK nuclease domain-containing protein [bacterium]
IDLKNGDLKHQDLGQMQMYVNYFDRYVKTEEENPTVGILLCLTKSDSLVELTLPKDRNIYASNYQLYLPSKEELKKQIEEAEKEFSKNK